MSSFSSSVIWLSMESTRRSSSADNLREGAGACADAENMVETINDKATIEQSLRMGFSFV
jgi:hypothetical protein